MSSSQKFIAERKLLFSNKDSTERKELVIRVGIPYWVDDNEAACPVKWDGLINELMETRGVDTLHALYLAVDIEPMLEKLRSKYDFYWPTGESYHNDTHLED